MHSSDLATNEWRIVAPGAVRGCLEDGLVCDSDDLLEEALRPRLCFRVFRLKVLLRGSAVVGKGSGVGIAVEIERDGRTAEAAELEIGADGGVGDSSGDGAHLLGVLRGEKALGVDELLALLARLGEMALAEEMGRDRLARSEEKNRGDLRVGEGRVELAQVGAGVDVRAGEGEVELDTVRRMADDGGDTGAAEGVEGEVDCAQVAKGANIARIRESG